MTNLSLSRNPHCHLGMGLLGCRPPNCTSITNFTLYQDLRMHHNDKHLASFLFLFIWAQDCWWCKSSINLRLHNYDKKSLNEKKN